MMKPEMIKPVYTVFRPENPRRMCSFIVPANTAGELSVAVKDDATGTGYRFITEVTNRFGKLLGWEQYTMHKGSDKATGLLITVEPEYRRKSYRLGEILRLTSIIEILENKIKSFEIQSKGSAVYFHSKYKFIPNIKKFFDRDKTLEAIIKNGNANAGFENFARQAKGILSQSKAVVNPEIQRKLCVVTNNLAAAYIQKVLRISPQEYKKHPFDYGMEMVLTLKNIKSNSEFFNKLFQNHGIDYLI